MPIGRVIRHSPLYLYLKLYSLSVLVTVFASRPISKRLGGQGESLQRQIVRIRTAAHDALLRQQAYAARIHSHMALRSGKRRPDSTAFDNAAGQGSASNGMAHSQTRTTGHPFPYALKTLSLDADTHFPAVPLRTTYDRTMRVLQRWKRRFGDLSMVKRSVKQERRDTKRYPELLHVANVRCSKAAHRSELDFINVRSQRIASDPILMRRLGIYPYEESQIHPDDIPRIAVGGSGGGYRATFGFLASLQGLHAAKVFDGIFWLAGVSGSCWTIASLYTVAAHCQGDPNEAMRHYKRVAAEALHPMSRGALDVVARSHKGVQFLLNPLLSKLYDGNVGIGVMDMYATLTTSYQLLSRSPHARPRLSRAMFEFSKVWHRAGVEQGRAPMPILTAVRRVPSPPEAKRNAKKSIDREDSQATLVHQRENVKENVFSTQNFQWWEMNPLEVGSSDEGAWVPTWSYGRGFVSGKSVSVAPEISLSLLLGQATSAPAGPLTGYITTLIATLPQGTVMSRMLGRLNDFVRHKRWEKRWANPIRGADEPNPLYGFGSRVKDDDDLKQQRSAKAWETRGRLKLMDSGLSNNLPNHIFTTQTRSADIILAFDQSSDVQTGAALTRLDDFAQQRNIYLKRDSTMNDAIAVACKDEEVRKRFCGKYAQVFQAWNLTNDDESQGPAAGLMQDQEPANDIIRRNPSFYLIYCPLLPHHCQPDFDPVHASFSTSYNLVWKPEEIDVLAKTAKASAMEYVIPVLQHIYKRVYETKRQTRLTKLEAATSKIQHSIDLKARR